ncbi:kinase-like protein [Rhizopus microsporus]|uniref:Kinase-like protein n=1 Tax=Rhizopus microsporus TaxID=58291 RepID=A0A1X0S4M7_RHIZD|nr:kinase-like protein [Rhizopus microsporus]
MNISYSITAALKINHMYISLQNTTLNAMLVRRRKLTEDEVRYIMGQILSAVRYISDNRIVHRDIKLGNVFLDKNMNCKLGDFGLSARLVNEFDRRKTTCGTPHYIAPEILFDSTGHNHRADMWSAGVLMYTLLFGKHPFHHDERRKLYQIVKQNKDSNTFSFPSEDFHVSADAKNLISSLLVNNPALKHPFFLSHNIPENLPRDALFKQPSHKSLYPSKYNNISSQSKVADSIRHAANENESYVDQSIQPPLELLEGTIHDIKWENSANAIKQRLSWITVHISLLSKHYLILRVWLYPNPIYPVCR